MWNFFSREFISNNSSVILSIPKEKRNCEIFKMAPLHHHYQKLGMHESKIVTRFGL